MLNTRIICKIIGSLLFIEAAVLTLCLAIALYYHEDDTLSFACSVATSAGLGLLFRFLGRNSDNTLSRRDAYLVVSILWVVFSLIGTLPFVISGYLPSFTDAFFETMSGFTTTGATVIDNVDALPHGLLFWRSLTQWIGGLGIVFFTTAILPSLVGGSVKVFAAESTGPIKTKLHPRLSTNSKWLCLVYLVITFLCAVSLVTAGMNVFDGINYGMTTAATGGFGTHGDYHFYTPAMQYILTFFCFIAGVNFSLLYVSASRRRLSLLLADAECRLYFLLVAMLSACIAVTLVTQCGYDVEHAIRSALFQVVSFITSTGFLADDPGLWPHLTWMALTLCMFTGACSGSTSGGFKCVRVVMLLKTISNEFRQLLHPSAVLPMKINGVNVTTSKRVTLLAFFSAYVLLAFGSMFLMMLIGVESTDAFTLSLSSLSNVGPALGQQIGPTMSWSSLPDTAKWLCSTLMLIGRLEIFSVLVVFTPHFWEER